VSVPKFESREEMVNYLQEKLVHTETGLNVTDLTRILYQFLQMTRDDSETEAYIDQYVDDSLANIELEPVELTIRRGQ
jgi:hypothetical protein